MVLCDHSERVQALEHRGRAVPELPTSERRQEHHQEVRYYSLLQGIDSSVQVQPKQQRHHIKGR